MTAQNISRLNTYFEDPVISPIVPELNKPLEHDSRGRRPIQMVQHCGNSRPLPYRRISCPRSDHRLVAAGAQVYINPDVKYS